MLRTIIWILLSSVVISCGSLQQGDADDDTAPATATRARASATIRAAGEQQETETPSPSSTANSGVAPHLTATAAGGSPIAATPPPCETYPTVDPVVAATEAAAPSNTPDPDFVPDYGATATAEAISTVPSGEPYCPDSVDAPPPATRTPPAGQATPLPVGALKPLTFSAGRELTYDDLVARGAGMPGRGEFNVARIQIANIGVDSPVASSAVGTDGQMPSPAGLFDVYWYDFSAFPGLGGLPGAGGNAIFAGSVGEGGANGVFVSVYTLAPGDAIQVVLLDGRTLTYRVEFNKIARTASADWQTIVAATADESLTIVTGSNTRAERRILWARRIK